MLGRAILRRTPVTEGSITFRGEDITHISGAKLRLMREHMQLVFQDPSTSLNPRHTVFEAIAEPLVIHQRAADKQALESRVAELIAHDLAVVRHVSHRIAIMYAGTIVEIGKRDDVFDSPRHPYTRSLLAAVPEPDRAVHRIAQAAVAPGESPSPMSPPSGCRFHPRCALAVEKCRTDVPTLVSKTADHAVACWLA